HPPRRPHRGRVNARRERTANGALAPYTPGVVTRAEPVDLGLALDRAAGRKYPLGQQVVDELRRRVQSGSLGSGERLPPVRGLASALGVTPETVAVAYKRLVE